MVYFSDAFGLTVDDDTDWFDPVLEIDTPLFVDPFLIYADETAAWAGSADALAAHFQTGFEILAGHQDNPLSLQYRKTVDIMKFPEQKEFCLGLTSKSTRGSGTGLGLARKIVEGMSIAVERGLADLHHFEELGVLVEKIGRDRISDITCNILKVRFIEYTKQVAHEHGLPVQTVAVPNAGFDELRRRWIALPHDLPVNPTTGQPILLTPKRFLRELPTLNAYDWWDYVEPGLRDDLNLDIGTRLPKASIVALARQHPDLVRAWTEARENAQPLPYDVNRDPEGLHDWQRRTANVAADAPLAMAAVDESNLKEFVRSVNEQFTHFVEEQGGWTLLFNDDTKEPKREASIQLLYKGVVQSYCRAHSVHLDREVELGRGPVDFIFTSGKRRVLMEIKKVRNGKFWNGLEDQLVSYMKSGESRYGWFLAVRFSNTPTEKTRTAELPARTRKLREDTGYDVHSGLVDARPKLSASKLDGVSDGTYTAAPDSEPDLD